MVRPFQFMLLAVAALAPLAGCMSEDLRRVDGLTTSAGDAIAANTAMQMVDPWQEGVQDTRLKVPAERPARAADAAESASATSVSGYN